MGLITPAAAEFFGVDVTSMAAQFTWLTGGVFAGYLLSFIVFDHFPIKAVLIVVYVTCIASLVFIHMATDYEDIAIGFTVFGVAISLASCGSGTLITQIWSGSARQTVLVAQDAMFNGGGVVFSMATTWFITNSLPFSSTYLVITGIIVFVLILSFVTNFRKDLNKEVQEDSEGKTEWNAGIIIMGISLLLFMMAKISMFIWAPQYVEQKFEVGSEYSGQFMSNIFTAALIGSLAGTWLVSRMNVKYLLYIFVLMSAGSIWLLTTASSIETMLLLAFVYGVSISATFNAYVAFALTFIAIPTHRNIAYMLVMSALGSSAAPFFSSMVVESTGDIEDAMMFCLVTLLVVIGSLVICNVQSKRQLQAA
jgi:fucose permease